MHDSVLKLDLLGHVDPMALRMMSLLTGVDIRSIPMNDKKSFRFSLRPKRWA
jgi:DNA polymerase-3 subunit alpha (Gram-positive type)